MTRLLPPHSRHLSRPPPPPPPPPPQEAQSKGATEKTTRKKKEGNTLDFANLPTVDFAEQLELAASDSAIQIKTTPSEANTLLPEDFQYKVEDFARLSTLPHLLLNQVAGMHTAGGDTTSRGADDDDEANPSGDSGMGFFDNMDLGKSFIH